MFFVCCSDLILELPFTLTHPKPKERVISQIVTLPSRSSLTSVSDAKGGADQNVAAGTQGLL